jgi:putative colanic acid biosynthesis acetyltransferase WcaF
MQINLNKFNNHWYKPGNFFKRAIWYYINAIFFNTSFFPFYQPKKFLLKIFGSKIGSGFVIKPNINIKYPWNLIIGDNVWLGEGLWIDNLGEVKIGSNVCISQGAMLLTGSHNYKKSTFDLIVDNIVIEDGVWVCAKVMLLPGTHLQENSVILPGSIIKGKIDKNLIIREDLTNIKSQRIINI